MYEGENANACLFWIDVNGNLHFKSGENYHSSINSFGFDRIKAIDQKEVLLYNKSRSNNSINLVDFSNRNPSFRRINEKDETDVDEIITAQRIPNAGLYIVFKSRIDLYRINNERIYISFNYSISHAIFYNNIGLLLLVSGKNVIAYKCENSKGEKFELQQKFEINKICDGHIVDFTAFSINEENFITVFCEDSIFKVYGIYNQTTRLLSSQSVREYHNQSVSMYYSNVLSQLIIVDKGGYTISFWTLG